MRNKNCIVIKYTIFKFGKKCILSEPRKKVYGYEIYMS